MPTDPTILAQLQTLWGEPVTETTAEADSEAAFVPSDGNRLQTHCDETATGRGRVVCPQGRAVRTLEDSEGEDADGSRHCANRREVRRTGTHRCRDADVFR